MFAPSPTPTLSWQQLRRWVATVVVTSVLLLLSSALAVSAAATATTSVEIVANCTANPLTALMNARDAVRALQPMRSDVTVLVIGTCRQTLALDAALDSGVNGFVITYRGSGEARNPPAILSGGVDVPWNLFAPSSAVPNAYQANLTALGLTQQDFGNFANGGLGQCGHTLMQLYISDTPMIVARTPNAHGTTPPQTSQVPWQAWLFPMAIPSNTTDVFIGNGTANYSTIAAAFADPSGRYADANANVWAHGYWAWDWADNYVRIANVSKVAPTAALSAPFEVRIDPSTPPIYNLKAGNNAGRFYLINHPVFLDAPGEYYVDQVQGTLTVIPPYPSAAAMANVVFSLSVQSSPLIAQVNDTSVPLTNVAFRDMALTYGRSSAVSIANAHGVVLDHLVVYGFTQDGINIGGTNVTVSMCSISQLGCSAVAVSGGDTQSLTPGNNTVAKNQLSNFARLTRSYSRGVYVGGVGAQVVNNFILNAPHQGISASGNNHAFVLNTLFNLCYGTIDAGAFYIGRSWVNRGMSLTDNTFDNIFIQEPVTHTGTMVSAIYWDDQQSGCTATGNTMRNVDNCFLLGGGRDNTITNNVCINSANYLVYFDNRGMNWQASMCTPPAGLLVEQLVAVNYTNPPFSVAYPRIVNTLSDMPCVPVGNVIAFNEYSACARGAISQTDATISQWRSEAYNNTEMSSPPSKN